MTESRISQITLVKSKEEYSSDENIEINVQFSVEGDLRNAFNEAKIWYQINIGGIQKKGLRKNNRFVPKSCNFLDKKSKISQSNER